MPCIRLFLKTVMFCRNSDMTSMQEIEQKEIQEFLQQQHSAEIARFSYQEDAKVSSPDVVKTNAKGRC